MWQALRTASRLVSRVTSPAVDAARVRLIKALQPDVAGEIDYRMLAENSGDVIILVGRDRRAQYVSPSSLQLFGWHPKEMIGRGPDKFFPREDLPRLQALRTLLVAGQIQGAPLPVRIIRKDGSFVWAEANARAVRNPSTGALTHFVLIMRDISERKLVEDRLSAMAMTDSLTSLANRRAFDEELPRAWQRTLSNAGEMSLLLIDIDYFKGFNDLYGHQVGDDCLRAVAASVAQVVGQSGDVAARYGGEELAVILPQAGEVEAAGRAEAIRAAVEALRLTRADQPQGREYVTVSVGAATALSRHGGTIRMPEGLLTAADAALYRAKHNGRNRVEATLLLAPDSTSKAA